MSDATSRNEQALSNARSQKYQSEQSKSSKETLYNINRNKIDRLYKVQAVLIENKSSAQKRKTNLSSYGAGENFTLWVGDKSTKVHSELNMQVVPGYEKYIQRIDDALDSVSDEITRLENENFQLNGDILYLASLINYLKNQIWTLLN